MKIMKKKNMTRWGIGPKFALITLAYTALVYWVQKNYVPDWTMDGYLIAPIGILLICLGVLVFIDGYVNIDRHYYRGVLCTEGVYKIVRHPIYGSWIILIIPGIVLYWGTWLGLTIPLVAYLVFRCYIHEEEDYLLKKFGMAYRNYKERTNAIFPRIF